MMLSTSLGAVPSQTAKESCSEIASPESDDQQKALCGPKEIPQVVLYSEFTISLVKI